MRLNADVDGIALIVTADSNHTLLTVSMVRQGKKAMNEWDGL